MQKLLLGLILIIIIGATSYILLKDRSDSTNTSNVTVTSNDVVSDYKIIAYGDSLTAGLNVPLSDSYPSKLERALGAQSINAKVINMGISGDTTYTGLERVDFVISNKPDLVLLSLGANDMLQGLPVKGTRDNLDKIIQKLVDNNIEVILLGMQSTASNGPAYKKEFDTIYKDLATKYNLTLMPFMLDGIALKSELNTSDGIHPNSTGYDVMINNMMPYVLKSKLFTR